MKPSFAVAYCFLGRFKAAWRRSAVPPELPWAQAATIRREGRLQQSRRKRCEGNSWEAFSHSDVRRCVRWITVDKNQLAPVNHAGAVLRGSLSPLSDDAQQTSASNAPWRVRQGVENWDIFDRLLPPQTTVIPKLPTQADTRCCNRLLEWARLCRYGGFNSEVQRHFDASVTAP